METLKKSMNNIPDGLIEAFKLEMMRRDLASGGLESMLGISHEKEY